MECKITGRVLLLSDFYRTDLRAEFRFIERVDYLRDLSALDEIDSKHPSVIIANYLTSPANCLVSTSFHSACCLDECEGLMNWLQVRYDSVDASRCLSASLMS